jgi:two-component system cell cycle response regulator
MTCDLEVVQDPGTVPGHKPDERRRTTADIQGRILVVDDYVVNRMQLKRSLEQQGHTAALAENGRQALEMLDGGDFDLVLLDIIMPEMDGFEVLARLKSDPARRDLPVIVISALDEMDSVVQCIKAGAEDYLPKPFDETLLHARIDACLEKKKFRDREIEYLRHVTQLTDAAAAVQRRTFAADQLASTAQRTDALGCLARVFQDMALEIYAREQEMQRAAAAREQALQEQLEKMQRDLAASQTAPVQVFEPARTIATSCGCSWRGKLRLPVQMGQRHRSRRLPT